jgi:hypothetical protein
MGRACEGPDYHRIINARNCLLSGRNESNLPITQSRYTTPHSGEYPTVELQSICHH